MSTPKVITDKAVATIGDATLFGNVYYSGNIATFSGSHVKLKRPLKHMVRTLQRRLQKDKEYTITGVHGGYWDNINSCNLITYGLSINISGKWTITFSLGEINEN